MAYVLVQKYFKSTKGAPVDTNTHLLLQCTVLKTSEALSKSYRLANKRTSGGGMIIVPWTPALSLLPSLIL